MLFLRRNVGSKNLPFNQAHFVYFMSLFCHISQWALMQRLAMQINHSQVEGNVPENLKSFTEEADIFLDSQKPNLRLRLCGFLAGYVWTSCRKVLFHFLGFCVCHFPPTQHRGAESYFRKCKKINTNWRGNKQREINVLNIRNISLKRRRAPEAGNTVYIRCYLLATKSK